jgi:hypothetical protein
MCLLMSDVLFETHMLMGFFISVGEKLARMWLIMMVGTEMA